MFRFKRVMIIIGFAAVIFSVFWLLNLNLGHITNASAADSPPGTNVDKAQNTTETELQQLLLERKQILQKIANTVAKQYTHGITDAEQVRQANLDLLNADLDLAKTPAERINIRSQIVRLYKEREAELTSQVTAGRANTLDLEKAKVARLTVEIELVKEQLAAKSTVK